MAEKASLLTVQGAGKRRIPDGKRSKSGRQAAFPVPVDIGDAPDDERPGVSRDGRKHIGEPLVTEQHRPRYQRDSLTGCQ